MSSRTASKKRPWKRSGWDNHRWLYAEWRQRRTARDERGNPVLDEEGRKKLEWVQRDRSLVKVQDVFNMEQTEGLKLIRGSGVRVDHVVVSAADRTDLAADAQPVRHRGT